VVVGALQSQIPKHAGKGFVAPIDIVCGLPARAGLFWTGVVGVVRIEALLEAPCGDLENIAAETYLGGFEIQFVDSDAVNQGLDFPEGGGPDLGLELRLEPPFLAASCVAASTLLSS
jgi:hypothetical protein